MRAFLVCVDYADILKVTLPYNRHHFTDVWVVTTERDAATREVALENRARVFATDAFYRNGAKFNKWLALEECLDYAGRLGWIALMDADVLWPKDVGLVDRGDRLVWLAEPGEPGCAIEQRIGTLVTPRRRMAPWPLRYDSPLPGDERTWAEFPLHRNDAEWAGYTQIFHADDPVLRWCGNCGEERGNCRPDCRGFAWHNTGYTHAGISDSEFQAVWDRENKVRPPWEVLHLGESGINWAGRATPLADGTEMPGSAERREYSGKTIWERRRANRAAGRDQFDGERIG